MRRRFGCGGLISNVASIGLTAKTTSSVLNPTTIVFGATPPVYPKLRPSGGSPGIGGLQNAINVLVNQSSARIGELAGGTAIGKGEWEYHEPGARTREKRLRGKWESGDQLLSINKSPALWLLLLCGVGSVPLALVGLPGSRSGFGPSPPLPFFLAEADGLMTTE